MTFEEFFIKKKIDLVQLQRANPVLYDEFHEHYHQMGEKSFDHTKKYWFNRLRKDYLLEVEETPAKPAATALPSVRKTTPTTDVAAAKPAGFKPRFKATATTAAPKAQTSPDKTAGSSPPTGFKPRFKAAGKPTVPPKSGNTGEAGLEKSSSTDPAPADSGQKPLGFKPKFKSGTTAGSDKKENTDSKPVTTEKTAEKDGKQPTKPLGFKPRFKSGITPANPDKKEEDPAPAPDATEKPSEKGNEQMAKPLGFKPRFKPGVTKPKKD